MPVHSVHFSTIFVQGTPRRFCRSISTCCPKTRRDWRVLARLLLRLNRLWISLDAMDCHDMGVSINGGTPSHHPFLVGIFPYKPYKASIWNYPHLWTPPYVMIVVWLGSHLFSLVPEMHLTHRRVPTCSHHLDGFFIS